MEQYEIEARGRICEIGRRLWQKNWVASNDGNISVRIGDDVVVTTPTGVSKGFMSPEMLVAVDMDGGPRDGGKPSTEIRLHLEAYRRRDDVRAVVHAHPPVSTGFAAANIPLDAPILPEVVLTLGTVPLARYAAPSTDALAASITSLITGHDAILLANHGVVTVGGDLFAAYYTMERVELLAAVSLAAHQIGGARRFTAAELAELAEVRARLWGGQDGGRAS